MKELKAIKERLYTTNRSLRLDNGLYVASSGEHYRKYVWIRDVFYQAYPNLENDPDKYIQTWQTILDYLHGLEDNYDNKISWLINQPFPIDARRIIHPRFYPDLREIETQWGNLQLDALGYILQGVALGEQEGLTILRNEADREVLQKLIDALEALRYWDFSDSGAWEEGEERKRSSSVASVLRGLYEMKKLGFVVSEESIRKGAETLSEILPYETKTRSVDLALLTLIWPHRVVDPYMAEVLLGRVHTVLERKNGVARYAGDKYYNLANPETIEAFGGMYNKMLDGKLNGHEAEWCFGFAYFAIIYAQRGDLGKAKYYLNKLIVIAGKNDWQVPELYYSKTSIPNDNNPLGWATAMMIVAIDEYEKAVKEKEIECTK